MLRAAMLTINQVKELRGENRYTHYSQSLKFFQPNKDRKIQNCNFTWFWSMSHPPHTKKEKLRDACKLESSVFNFRRNTQNQT